MSPAIRGCVAEPGLRAATPGSVMEPRATGLVAELGRNEGTPSLEPRLSLSCSVDPGRESTHP